MNIDLSSCVAALVLVFAAGCGESLKVGQVNGQLLIQGKPAPEIFVEFVPVKGVEGPIAAGATDAEGRFTLEYKERGKPAKPGAMVGTNVVTLSDMRLGAIFDSRKAKPRFRPEYSTAVSSPLRQDVVEGEQQVMIEAR